VVRLGKHLIRGLVLETAGWCQVGKSYENSIEDIHLVPQFCCEHLDKVRPLVSDGEGGVRRGGALFRPLEVWDCRDPPPVDVLGAARDRRPALAGEP